MGRVAECATAFSNQYPRRWPNGALRLSATSFPIWKPADAGRIRPTSRKPPCVRRRQGALCLLILLGRDELRRRQPIARAANRLGVNERISDQNTAAERQQALDNSAPNAAEANDACGQLLQGFHLIFADRQAPAAGAHQIMVKHDLPRERQDEGQRLVGDLIDAIIRDIAHRNATVARGLQIHVVHADTITNNHPRLLHRRNHVRVNFSKLGDDCISI